MSGKSAVTLADDTESNDYTITARVFLRQREYPYEVLSREPHPKVMFKSSQQEVSVQFTTDSEMV